MSIENEVRNHSEQLDKAAQCIRQLYGIVVGILVVVLMIAAKLYFCE